MWQSLYDRLRKVQTTEDAPSAAADGGVVFLRHPPPDEEPRCPQCTGVRLVPADDPSQMRCIWCTRVYDRSELEAA